jgi:hypothetical protein
MLALHPLRLNSWPRKLNSQLAMLNGLPRFYSRDKGNIAVKGKKFKSSARRFNAWR